MSPFLGKITGFERYPHPRPLLLTRRGPPGCHLGAAETICTTFVHENIAKISTSHSE
jgi:hypothetical protein